MIQVIQGEGFDALLYKQPDSPILQCDTHNTKTPFHSMTSDDPYFLILLLLCFQIYATYSIFTQRPHTEKQNIWLLFF